MNMVILSILLVIVGIFLGVVINNVISNIKKKNATLEAEKIIEDAKKEAQKSKRDSIMEAKEEINRIKIESDRDIKEKKVEIKENEKRLIQREENIDKRDLSLQNREKLLDERDNNLLQKQKEIQEKEVNLEKLEKKKLEILESISGYSSEEAKKEIMNDVEHEMDLEISSYIKERESEAILEADKKAKNLLVTSMQRYSGDVTNEQTVTVVNLPSDEMKGRIIGREGRNIRTIESVTGVDIIIDDTPEALVISSFDPLRREIAKITLDTLIKDGRIHPTRIEEVYDKVCNEMNAKLLELGQETIYELGITKMDTELIKIIGRLYFRTSFGQNALKHSKEVATLSGILASEIGEDSVLAKRAGLLHDIGKAVDSEIEGSHVDIGIEIAKKYNENEIVINSIASHHGDYEAKSIIAHLVAIADTMSASRPGARNDSFENYVKRVSELEAVANNFEGVDKSYALSAGRELRVLVKPEEIDDRKSYKLARDLKEKIESELRYPGTVKITVVRETRAVEEAK